MNKEQFRLDDIVLQDKRVFRDAIHNYIHVDHSVILDLINSDAMQRLRRIKQLGGSHQVYQSAEHTRFTHSLGVYAIVKRMIEESEVGDALSDYDKLTVMIAGLLHDLGHGPFSHCFERVFNCHHEDYTIKIIQDNPQIHHILEDCVPGLSQDVVDVILKKHPNRILIQMISSQLDCDRMDYLLRDSYFTGTTYGQFDLSRILRVIQIKDGKIVYKKSGVQAIENYILARYHMYWQVYYHPTIRSYEQLLISTIKRAEDLYHQGDDLQDIRYLKPFFDRCVSVQDYLNLDEGIIFYYMRCFTESEDAILKDLSSRFLNRRLFQYCDYHSLSQKQELENKYLELGFLPEYYISVDDQSQIPYLHYGSNDAISEIEIIDYETLVPLPDISEIVGAIVSSNKSKNDHKIFYP